MIRVLRKRVMTRGKAKGDRQLTVYLGVQTGDPENMDRVEGHRKVSNEPAPQCGWAGRTSALLGRSPGTWDTTLSQGQHTRVSKEGRVH